MDSMDILIPISILLCLFGVIYLYFTTRNRERMALIEKGLKADLLNLDSDYIRQVRRNIILNIALSLIGIGLGITFGIVLHHLTGKDAVYPASIFIMAGVGLLTSFLMQRK